MNDFELFSGVDKPDEDNERRETKGCWCIGLIEAVLAAVALVLIACSCKTIEVVKEVPVVTEHTTVQHRTDIVRDTLVMRDSVYHYVQGDTVIIERWHNTQAVNRYIVADTVRDTIPQAVTVTKTEIKEVEKKLHWWQNALMWLGGLLMVLLGAALPGWCGGSRSNNRS